MIFHKNYLVCKPFSVKKIAIYLITFTLAIHPLYGGNNEEVIESVPRTKLAAQSSNDIPYNEREKIVVIGGGLAGAVTALLLATIKDKKRQPLYHVTLVEAEELLLNKTSKVIARLHLGGEYPLDAETAFQCLDGAILFRQMFPEEILTAIQRNAFLVAKESDHKIGNYEAHYRAIQKRYEGYFEKLGEIYFNETGQKFFGNPFPLNTSEKTDHEWWEHISELPEGFLHGVLTRERGINMPYFGAFLELLLEESGVEIKLGTEVIGPLSQEAHRYRVKLSSGEIYASQVVNATGSNIFAMQRPQIFPWRSSSQITKYDRVIAFARVRQDIPIFLQQQASIFGLEGEHGGMVSFVNGKLAVLFWPGYCGSYYDETYVTPELVDPPLIGILRRLSPSHPQEENLINTETRIGEKIVEHLAKRYGVRMEFLGCSVQETLSQDSHLEQRKYVSPVTMNGQHHLTLTKGTTVPILALETLKNVLEHSKLQHEIMPEIWEWLSSFVGNRNAPMYNPVLPQDFVFRMPHDFSDEVVCRFCQKRGLPESFAGEIYDSQVDARKLTKWRAYQFEKEKRKYIERTWRRRRSMLVGPSTMPVSTSEPAELSQALVRYEREMPPFYDTKELTYAKFFRIFFQGDQGEGLLSLLATCACARYGRGSMSADIVDDTESNDGLNKALINLEERRNYGRYPLQFSKLARDAANVLESIGSQRANAFMIVRYLLDDIMSRWQYSSEREKASIAVTFVNTAMGVMDGPNLIRIFGNPQSPWYKYIDISRWGEIYMIAGEYKRAKALMLDATQRFVLPYFIAGVEENLARVCIALREYQEALTHAIEATRIYRGSDNTNDEIRYISSLFRLTEAYSLNHMLNEAEKTYDEAVQMMEAHRYFPSSEMLLETKKTALQAKERLKKQQSSEEEAHSSESFLEPRNAEEKPSNVPHNVFSHFGSKIKPASSFKVKKVVSGGDSLYWAMGISRSDAIAKLLKKFMNDSYLREMLGDIILRIFYDHRNFLPQYILEDQEYMGLKQSQRTLDAEKRSCVTNLNDLLEYKGQNRKTATELIESFRNEIESPVPQEYLPSVRQLELIIEKEQTLNQQKRSFATNENTVKSFLQAQLPDNHYIQYWSSRYLIDASNPLRKYDIQSVGRDVPATMTDVIAYIIRKNVAVWNYHDLQTRDQLVRNHYFEPYPGADTIHLLSYPNHFDRLTKLQ